PRRLQPLLHHPRHHHPHPRPPRPPHPPPHPPSAHLHFSPLDDPQPALPHQRPPPGPPRRDPHPRHSPPRSTHPHHHTAPLAAPTNLAVTAVTSSTVALAWTTSNEATSYRVLRKGPTDTNFIQVGTPSDPHFRDTGLSLNTTYLYEVVAVSSLTISASSNIV